MATHYVSITLRDTGCAASLRWEARVESQDGRFYTATAFTPAGAASEAVRTMMTDEYRTDHSIRGR